MVQTIEIWRACGIGFFVAMFTFTIGIVIGKGIGWNQCGRLLRPSLFPPRNRNRQHPTRAPDLVGCFHYITGSLGRCWKLFAPYDSFYLDRRIIAMKHEEGKDADKLRARGFTHIDREVSLAVRSTLPHKLSRNQRRQLRKQKYRPWFSTTSLTTFATDETGFSWQGPPNTDLTDLGFEDKSRAAQEHMREMNNKDPNLN